MRKRLLAAWILLMALALCAASSAEIIRPEGPGQLGYSAVVISKAVTVRPTTDANARAVKRLNYGDRIAVMSLGNGWCEVYLSETEGLSGYVLEDYILVDPAYVLIEESTPVYAWQATNAKRVGLISKGETYPIIRMEGNWLLISLRGAAGWMLRPSGDASGRARMKTSNVIKAAQTSLLREYSWISASDLNNYYVFAEYDMTTRTWTVTYDDRNGNIIEYTVDDDTGAVDHGGTTNG